MMLAGVAVFRSCSSDDSPPSKPPAERTVSKSLSLRQVMAGRATSPAQVGATTCDRLWEHRNWVFARHGMRFGGRAGEHFRRDPDYTAVPGVTMANIGTYLTPADVHNRDLILRMECDRGCRVPVPCPSE
jgi:hypothetical protein